MRKRMKFLITLIFLTFAAIADAGMDFSMLSSENPIRRLKHHILGLNKPMKHTENNDLFKIMAEFERAYSSTLYDEKIRQAYVRFKADFLKTLYAMEKNNDVDERVAHRIKDMRKQFKRLDRMIDNAMLAKGDKVLTPAGKGTIVETKGFIDSITIKLENGDEVRFPWYQVVKNDKVGAYIYAGSVPIK